MITFLTYNYVCVCTCISSPYQTCQFSQIYDWHSHKCLSIWFNYNMPMFMIIYYICVCVFKVLRMLDDCMKVFLIGAMWNNTVKYLRFEVFKTRYILNSTPSLISWSVNYVFNILKFNKKLVNPLPRHCILYILCYIYVYLMSRLKLCVCMLSYEEMSWNTFGWVIDSRSLPVSFSLSLSFSFLLILLMTVLMYILLFFIEIVYCFMASFSQWPHG